MPEVIRIFRRKQSASDVCLLIKRPFAAMSRRDSDIAIPETERNSVRRNYSKPVAQNSCCSQGRFVEGDVQSLLRAMVGFGLWQTFQHELHQSVRSRQSVDYHRLDIVVRLPQLTQ